MSWHQTVFELIDMRSFPSLWFWIFLASSWSVATWRVLGVPHDMILRARDPGSEAERDLAALVQINCRRLLALGAGLGAWGLGGAAFLFTTLFLLGFFYHVEFAQALFLLGFPLALAGSASLVLARRLQARPLAGPPLCHCLLRHRILLQSIGVVAIIVTVLWGTYQNISSAALIG